VEWEGRLSHYRVDQKHSNAFEKWKALGSPQKPTSEQYAELVIASKLTTVAPPKSVVAKDGSTAVAFDLPRRGVSLLLLEKV
jgi:xylan 1,4-beta-xylosidase